MAREPESSQQEWQSELRVDAHLAEVIEANYGQFQYHFVEFIVAHLADCSRVFGGDLQELLVLGIIGQVFLSSYNAGRSAEDQIDYGGISASRLADVSGIPRETVRRKLRSLSKRGWIVQTEDAQWKLLFENGAAAARKDLSELDRRGLIRMVKTILRLGPILKI